MRAARGGSGQREGTGWRAAAAWAAALGWAALVWGLGSDPFSHQSTSRFLGPLLAWLLPDAGAGDLAFWHGLLRKGAHVGEYGVLAGLLWVALALSAPWRAGARAAAALLAVAALASADEWRQTHTPSRTGSPVDVLLDLTGGSLALAVAWQVGRLRERGNGPRGGT